MNKLILIYILIALGGFANAVMDTIIFRWKVSAFKNWTERDTRFGRAMKYWLGPVSETWQNKGRSKYWLIRAIMSGPLVFLTDAWHFFQFIMFTSYQLIIALLLPIAWPQLPEWVNVVAFVLIFKTIHGLIFEPFYKIFSMTQQKKRALLLWIKELWYLISVAILGTGFFLPYAMVYWWDLTSTFWFITELIIAGAAIVLTVKFILWAMKPIRRDES